MRGTLLEIIQKDALSGVMPDESGKRLFEVHFKYRVVYNKLHFAPKGVNLAT